MLKMKGLFKMYVFKTASKMFSLADLASEQISHFHLNSVVQSDGLWSKIVSLIPLLVYSENL